MLLGPIDDALTNAEVGYTACAFLLCGLLSRVYARPIVGGAPTPIA
jgi:hypothetical protein